MRSIKEAVTRLNCDNLLECFYGLNEADITVFNTLRKLGESRIEIISKAVGRGENAVYKSLQKMMIAGLVIRDKKTIEDGGYYYIYRAEDVNKLAEEMINLLEQWYNKMKEVIEEFLKIDEKDFKDFNIKT
jgi:predicted transcriptional regulator